MNQDREQPSRARACIILIRRYQHAGWERERGENAMHARVVALKVKPLDTDEVVRIYRDSVLPAAKQQRGSGGPPVDGPRYGRWYLDLLVENGG